MDVLSLPQKTLYSKTLSASMMVGRRIDPSKGYIRSKESVETSCPSL